MTPTQRNFRKQMKKLGNEGKIPIQYNYKKKRVAYKRLIGIVAVILLVLNGNTLYSWIAPHLNKSIDYFNISSLIRYDTNLASNMAIQSQHKAVSDYLNTGEIINEKLSLIIKRVYKRTGDGDKYSAEEIHNELMELGIFKEKFSESKFVEYRLNDLYLRNISITEEMLNSLDKSNKELYSLREDYSANINQIQNAMIEFLEGNKIEYEIGTNQTITYYLMQAENNATNREPEMSLATTVDPSQSMENIAEGKLTYKDIIYKWEYPVGVRAWEYKLEIPIETVNYYKSIDRNDIDGYSYYVTHEADDEYLYTLANQFKATGKKENLSEFDTINLAVSFVQSLEYVPDDIGTGFDDYPKFPLETLYDEGGDCEDSSILLASLLRELGYGTVLVLFDNHMGVGAIASEPANFKYEGNNYHYIETTNTGWAIGQLPTELKRKQITIIPVNK